MSLPRTAASYAARAEVTRGVRRTVYRIVSPGQEGRAHPTGTSSVILPIHEEREYVAPLLRTG